MQLENAIEVVEKELQARWIIGIDPMWASDWNKPYYCNLEEVIFELNEGGVPNEGCSHVYVPKKRTNGNGASIAEALTDAAEKWKAGKFQ